MIINFDTQPDTRSALVQFLIATHFFGLQIIVIDIPPLN